MYGLYMIVLVALCLFTLSAQHRGMYGGGRFGAPGPRSPGGFLPPASRGFGGPGIPPGGSFGGRSGIGRGGFGPGGFGGTGGQRFGGGFG